MAGVGSACLVVALLTAAYAVGASLYGVRAGRREWVTSGRRAIYCIAALCLVAFGLLEAAFLRSDFSFALVAEGSSTSTPTFYKVTAVWATQDGSLLLLPRVDGRYARIGTVASLEEMGRLPNSDNLVTLVVSKDRRVVEEHCRGALALGPVYGCQVTRHSPLGDGTSVRLIKIVRYTDRLPSEMALEIRACLERLRWPSGAPISIRIGIACGPVVAGAQDRRQI